MKDKLRNWYNLDLGKHMKINLFVRRSAMQQINDDFYETLGIRF